GVRPFVGETAPAVHVAISTKRLRPLRELRPEVPEALEAAIGACLRKVPSARPASVAELATQLLPFCKGADAAFLVERIAHMGGDPVGEQTPDPLAPDDDLSDSDGRNPPQP